MRRATVLLTAVALNAACGQPAANHAALGNSAENAAMPAAAGAAAPEGNAVAPAAAASQDRVLRSETVTGTFTGWEMGDYLWAQIRVAGRAPLSAQPGPSPIDLFLDANRGRAVTVEVATVRTDIPEAGGAMEIRRITAARNATTTAEAWWRSLPAADRAAAQRRFEQGALSGR